MKTGATRPAARRGFRLCVLALCAAGLDLAADAHHSYAVFDASKTITVKGVVKEVQWTNPHVWLQLTVKGADGSTQEYSFEGGAIGVLKRAGWMRDTVKPGDEVSINSHPFRSGKPGGSLELVTLSDSRRFAAGNGVPSALVIGGEKQAL